MGRKAEGICGKVKNLGAAALDLVSGSKKKYYICE